MQASSLAHLRVCQRLCQLTELLGRGAGGVIDRLAIRIQWHRLNVLDQAAAKEQAREVPSYACCRGKGS
eukprot:1161671-Pelagomonas_calceolata.AAC.8